MGKVALIADNHFLYEKKTKNIYVSTMYSYKYFKRFVDSFSEFVVIARGKVVDECNHEKYLQSNGNGVEFRFITDFTGVKEYIANRNRIKKDIYKCCIDCDAIIIRMPCILTEVALDVADKMNKYVILDVGADPEDAYGKKNIFSKILSQYLKKMCKDACLRANGVSYVTQTVLQNKYPCRAIIEGESKFYFTAPISNVNISQTYLSQPREFQNIEQLKMIHIATNITKNSTKGHRECIQVLKRLVEDNIDAELYFIGDGTGVRELKELANSFDICKRVHFCGRFSNPEDVRRELINSDLFLFPSYTEGLPRSLIEAMACGLVCIASNVGGIPELLHDKDLVEYYNIEGMVKQIENYYNDRQLMNIASKRNIEVASNYTIDKIENVCSIFYKKINCLIDDTLE